MRYIKYILIGVFAALKSYGQDPHFSLAASLPLYLNPANTGTMDGTVRTGLDYRNQWNSIAAPFESANLYGDYKTNIKNMNNRQVGIGFQYINERTGNGVFNNNYFQISGSTPFYLNKDQSQVIYGGVYLGFYQSSLNGENFNFESNFDYTSVQFSNGESVNNGSSFVLDMGIGATYHYYDITGKEVIAGISLAHPSQPTVNYGGIAIDNKLSLKTNWHAQGRYPISSGITLTPFLLYSNQRQGKSTVIGSGIEYPLGRRVIEKIDLLAGLYYRINDALILSAGMNHENWTIQFGYDINTSGLAEASNGIGAIEIGISYVNRMFKGHKDLRYVVPGTRLL